MENVEEVASAIKQWLTLESEIATESESEDKKYVTPEEDIAEGKAGLDGDIEPVRQEFANLLFSGQMDWLLADNDELVKTLPEWFLPGSNDEYYLEQYATGSRTDVKPMLNFLNGRLTIWAHGEGRPQQNPDYQEGTSPAGTQWYKYEDGQYLYSPTETGADWLPMEQRAPAARAKAQAPVGGRRFADVRQVDSANRPNWWEGRDTGEADPEKQWKFVESGAEPGDDAPWEDQMAAFAEMDEESRAGGPGPLDPGEITSEVMDTIAIPTIRMLSVTNDSVKVLSPEQRQQAFADIMAEIASAEETS